MIINPKKILNDWIVTGFLNEEDQLQQNGIDLTVKSIKRVIDHSTLTTETREIAGRTKDSLIVWKEEVLLEPGVYDIEFNEHVKIPDGMCAQIIQRSSVNRWGVLIMTWLYDSWFDNTVGAVMYVINPFGFRTWENTKLAQIVFMQADNNGKYEGIYQWKQDKSIETLS